jgi:catechol 2,3-dioxygenase-like lactoylglutathione lyase family enzyme
MSYEERAGAVLYAKDIDRVAAFYVAVLGLEVAAHDREHVLLESRALQLVVLQVPPHIASTIEITVPPVRRADAAVKLVFFVPSIAAVRRLAEAHGGVLRGPKQEWTFNGYKVCDGLDPEGNVIQFRARAV